MAPPAAAAEVTAAEGPSNSSSKPVAAATCDACGKPAPAGEKLKYCRGCRVARYCGMNCYARAWKELGHRSQCRQMQTGAAP